MRRHVPLKLCNLPGQGTQLGRDPASGSRQLMQLLEKCVLCHPGQVGQQPFQSPCGGLFGIEPGPHQRIRPVITQVDGHRHPTGRRTSLRPGEYLIFEFENPRLVHLEDGRTRGPGQSVRTGV